MQASVLDAATGVVARTVVLGGQGTATGVAVDERTGYAFVTTILANAATGGKKGLALVVQRWLPWLSPPSTQAARGSVTILAVN